MAAPTKSEEIQQAHKTGTLLLHLLEFNTTKMPDQLLNFFNVLAGKPEAEFDNFAHQVKSLPNEGYLGLATTSLKKDHPVKLYYESTHYTGIGLLMTADSPHVTPLYVTSIDAWSSMDNGKCRVANKDEEPYPELRTIQGLPLSGRFLIDLTDDRERVARAGKARQALTRMWELIERDGILKPEAELNEVLVLAHSKGIKGIVIDEGPSEGPAILDDKAPSMTKATFIIRVNEAKKLQAWLKEEYQEHFPDPLPIFSYSKLAENQLVELTKEQLRTGRMPDHGKILWPQAGNAVNRTTSRSRGDGSFNAL